MRNKLISQQKLTKTDEFQQKKINHLQQLIKLLRKEMRVRTIFGFSNSIKISCFKVLF